MIVVAVVAILAAIALPSYWGSVRKTRRSDAMAAMNSVQLAEEKYRANNTTYGTMANLALSTTSEGGYYTIAVASNTATGYTVTAVPVVGKSQVADTGCNAASGATTMTLVQAGANTTYTPATCWNK
jgi:type IV pilus assembly protein PilE